METNSKTGLRGNVYLGEAPGIPLTMYAPQRTSPSLLASLGGHGNSVCGSSGPRDLSLSGPAGTSAETEANNAGAPICPIHTRPLKSQMTNTHNVGPSSSPAQIPKLSLFPEPGSLSIHASGPFHIMFSSVFSLVVLAVKLLQDIAHVLLLCLLILPTQRGHHFLPAPDSIPTPHC